MTKTKKGVPLYSNLVNLKSNTMKNTPQRYTSFLQDVKGKRVLVENITKIN